jgi:thiamine biosynthesis protein ThiI
MGLILLRYGEIALKGQNRSLFYRKLRRNARECLKANGIQGNLWQDGQRIYVETGQVEAAIGALQRVFGLVSLSPVQETCPDLEAISRGAVALAQRAGLGWLSSHHGPSSRPACLPEGSFRVTARRADKAFPIKSPEIERVVGSAVQAATNARVDLSGEVDLEIGVEVHANRALVFGEVIPGPGGLPLGSQGKVVALLSSGIDSPVAIWLMMKRGCRVIPVHFSTSPAQTSQVEAIVEALNEYAYGWELRPIILSHEQILGPRLASLGALKQERWVCLFCKHALLSRAAEIADEMDAGALVTGDSLGQVASQTLSNLEAISYGIKKPILRPLIGLDKTEIIARARQIGTYALSTRESHSCPYLPRHPLTQASLDRLRALQIEMAELEDQTRSPESSGTVKKEPAQ